MGIPSFVLDPVKGTQFFLPLDLYELSLPYLSFRAQRGICFSLLLPARQIYGRGLFTLSGEGLARSSSSDCIHARYKSPARYLKPLSTATVATVLPRPSSCANCNAAATFNPDEVPANIPSSFANRRAISRAAPSSTVRTSSKSPSFKCGGLKPAAIPSTRCAPPFPVVSTGEPTGSSATMRALHPASFSARDTPIIIPAVPTPPQNAVRSSPACSTSSLPIPM